jgi:hypothetical protein
LFEDEKDCAVQCRCMGNVMFLPAVQNDNSLLRETDKVYIHYGTFQFQLNACITKPCVYDMKKVIICFITNVT